MWKGRNRKSPRLRGFDYASNAAYFVTINCHQHQHLFGEIINGEMHLNDLADIVWWEWHKSEEMRKEVDLDAFVVMPNHIHGIVLITPDLANSITNPTPVGTTRASSLHQQPPQFKPGPPKRSLGAFIGGFKSAVTKKIHQTHPYLEVWQERYHDHIIRNQRDLEIKRGYIENNPANWDTDEENQ